MLEEPNATPATLCKSHSAANTMPNARTTRNAQPILATMGCAMASWLLLLILPMLPRPLLRLLRVWLWLALRPVPTLDLSLSARVVMPLPSAQMALNAQSPLHTKKPLLEWFVDLTMLRVRIPRNAVTTLALMAGVLDIKDPSMLLLRPWCRGNLR